MSNLKADVRRWFKDNPAGTAKECAADIGVHQSTVYKYKPESKRKKPTRKKTAERSRKETDIRPSDTAAGGTVISKCPKCGGSLEIEVVENFSLCTRYKYKKGKGIDARDFAANMSVASVEGNPNMRISRAVCSECGEVWLHGYDFIIDGDGKFISLKNNLRYEGK